ncbi:hypothetical protein D3C79_749210 [compost metagenome]
MLGITVAQGTAELVGIECLAGKVLQAAGVQGRAQADRAESTGAGQKAFAQQGDVGLADQTGEGVDAHRRVIVVIGVELRVHVRPILAQQVVDQLQGAGKAGNAMQGQGTLQQEMSDAKVFAALQQGGAGLFDLPPLGRFGRLDGIAHDTFGLALGITLQLQEVRVVFKVVAARKVLRNGSEQMR